MTRTDSDSRTVEEALEALPANELRALIRDLIPWLEDGNLARLRSAVLDRAVRAGTGWVPPGPSDRDVREAERQAATALQSRWAEPDQVDLFLRLGSNAFLCREYETAARIFRAWLPPIVDAEIDLGQHEMLDEVLTTDLSACALRFAIAVYFTTPPEDRPAAVLKTMIQTRDLFLLWKPLAAIEREAVEPMPEWDVFLAGWRTVVEGHLAAQERQPDGSDANEWLREVVHRTEGPDGLGDLARRSREYDDHRAWCEALVEASRWEDALVAYEEAAATQLERGRSGQFLDGVALAAYKLERPDWVDRLERAWRLVPTQERLLRWLWTSPDQETLRARADDAIQRGPRGDDTQHAMLCLLRGDWRAAAKLLACAPGLGWSAQGHPGHLLFPFFFEKLGGPASWPRMGLPPYRTDEKLRASRNPFLRELHTCLPAGTFENLLERFDACGEIAAKDVPAVLGAMRIAAEKRVNGVIRHKRRRHYGHAASLARACLQVEPGEETQAWFSAIEHTYRRYPAFQRELRG